MAAPLVEIPERFNAASIFVDEQIKQGRGERVAIAYGDQTYTYAQVLEGVNRCGNMLRSLGVEAENRVMLLTLDCPEMVFGFFGAMKIGAVPIPTNTLLRAPDYEYLLNDSRAKVVIVSEPLLTQVEQALPNLKHLKHIVVVGNAHRNLSYHELTGKASEFLRAEEMSRDDTAFWLYSSGTTGFPKGAVHLHHDMLVTSRLYAKPVLGINQNDRTLSVAKLFFAYGLGNALYFPFSVGASTVLYPGRPDPIVYFQSIEKYKPTIFYGVPTMYAAMLAVEGAEKKYDLSSLRFCVSAGEALPAAFYERWKQKFGVEILDGIGSTEILHIFISNRAGRVKPGSSGELVPGYEAKIVDERGQPVPPGEVGDLLVKGDSTCPYYWNKHQKTKETIIGEWIRTGDKYVQDTDGYFWYQGRSDDMLKAGGIWVSPVEVEATLVQHPAVLEAGVVGHADSDALVKPMAYVVLKQGQTASDALAKELQDFVKDKIAPYKYPRWIRFVPELPKTATGKIQRYKLRG
ncbi:MAG: benzoate-CoA ligase family protein [Chloroflexi bacterium]|nr:benzoate-CoA ligase family protein [Chloroflexota bacterium]